MSFLNPALLTALLPLVALPLVIHLLNRQFPKLFRFSSVEHIKETMARRSRLHRWRHLILLALRTLFLVLLLLAFLKPILEKFGSAADLQGRRVVLILLDHSLSMGYKGEGPSPHERAVHEAGKLIDTLGADDWLNIVLLQQNPTSCFVDFSKNHADARRFLQTLQPGLTCGNVNSANAFAARLLAKTQGRVELYYISDFQRKNWANADFTALPPSVRPFFVDVGSHQLENHAILDARLSQSEVLAGDTVPLEITIGNFSEQPFRQRVTVVLDKRLSFDHDTFLAPWSVGKVTLPVPAGGPGLHLCEVALPPDGLEPDNHFSLTLPVLEKEEVVILSDEPQEKAGSVYFLKTALNPYENLAGSLLPKTIPSAELSLSRLAGVKKMFITRINRLSDENCAVLGKFLFQGGGLIYFLDGPADAENLLSFEKALGPGTIPIRLTAHRTAANIAAGAQQIVQGDFESRFLKLFRGPTRQDLGLLEFYDYYQASSTGAGHVLLTYADESPAMALTGHGLGTLVLLNFSASELSGNLPRQRIFPAWMQDLVKAVSVEEPPATSYVIGDVLHTEVWKHEMQNDEFTGPAGQSVTVKRQLVGDRYAVSFVPEQLGLYTLGDEKPLYAFAVNASPDESDLRPMDKAMLPSALSNPQQAHFVAGQEDYETVAKGQPLFHWFILGAVVFLLLESGFQLLIRRKAARTV